MHVTYCITSTIGHELISHSSHFMGYIKSLKFDRLHRRHDMLQFGNSWTKSQHAIDGIQVRGMLGLSLLCFLLPADLLVVLQHLHYLVMSELHCIIDWQVTPPAHKWSPAGPKHAHSEIFHQLHLLIDSGLILKSYICRCDVSRKKLAIFRG